MSATRTRSDAGMGSVGAGIIPQGYGPAPGRPAPGAPDSAVTRGRTLIAAARNKGDVNGHARIRPRGDDALGADPPASNPARAMAPVREVRRRDLRSVWHGPRHTGHQDHTDALSACHVRGYRRVRGRPKAPDGVPDRMPRRT